MNAFCAGAHLEDRLSRNTARSLNSIRLLLVIVILVGGMVLMGAQSSAAQDRGEQNSPSSPSAEQRVEGPNGPSSSPGLPSWAEPSAPTPEWEGSTVEKQSGTNAPAPPSPPSRLPVDGGLALLAAAGAGYAVRKLQKDDEG